MKVPHEGYHNVCRSQRVKKMIFRKYQDSTIHRQLFKRYQGLYKVILDLVVYTYVERSSTIIQDLLRCHHPVFPFLFKAIEIEDCFGPTIFRNHYK